MNEHVVAMCIFKIRELRNDFITSVATVVLLFFVDAFFINLNFIFDNIYNSFEAIMSIGATMTGFLITALTILLVFPENSRIRFLKTHPTFTHIFDAYILAISLFVSMFVMSFFLEILAPFRLPYLGYLLVFVIVWSIVSLFRCVWLLRRVIDVYYHKGSGESDRV